MYTVFGTAHVISDINDIYQFQDIRRIFPRVRACSDGEAARQTNQMHKTFLNIVGKC